MIRNRSQLINLGKTAADKKARRDLLNILEFTLQAADPYFLTLQALKKINFKKYRRVFVIGAGKGTYRMALAAEGIVGRKLAEGWINIPEAIPDGVLKKIKITLAGHPFPNQGSVLGARRILSLAQKAEKDDLVLALFSGGASALFSLPVLEVSLSDKIKINQLLLRCGATIDEVNAVRKHLSQVKGGWLAKKATRTNLVAFYLSDVVGNDLSTVASGPTVADLSTYPQAIKILRKYKIWQAAPKSVREYLTKGARGNFKAPETPKSIPANVKNMIIGSHESLVRAAQEKGEQLGYKARIITDQMKGLTEKIGPRILKKIKEGREKFLLIAAGETTFKVRTKKPGGRNQQMGLAVLSKIKLGQYFLAFDSDGVDGVSNREESVGGILIDYQTLQEAKRQKLNIKKALQTNNSYNFFKKVGGQIKTGYVGTNFGDLVLAIKE